MTDELASREKATVALRKQPVPAPFLQSLACIERATCHSGRVKSCRAWGRTILVGFALVPIACGASTQRDGSPANTSPAPDAGTPDVASTAPPDADGVDAGTDAGSSDDRGPGGAFRAYAENAASGLRDLYNLSTGLYPSTGWWNSANGITAAIDYSLRTGSPTYVGDVGVTFDKNSGQNFLNKFYDDEGWWALAWIDAFDLTKEARYLDMAKTIFSDMAGGWDSTCGGGIWWNKDRQYKNAIANELFFEIAVRLHQRTPGDTGANSFGDYADREWAWFAQSGMINADNLVNDGLDNCKNNGQTTWTYNQGVLVGALVELAQVKGDSTLLDRAEAIATATMTKLVDDQGVLREPCEPSCGGDGPQFKGIFMRNLATLTAARPSASLVRFIAQNADWAWNAAHTGAGAGTRVGLGWSHDFDSGDAARQASGLDLFNAAIAFDAPQTNLALGKSTTTSAPCSAGEGGDNAVDGKVSSKWCGSPSSGPTWLEVDLGASTDVGRIIVRHAGAGGEDVGFDTKDFSLSVGTDGTTWSKVASVTGNTRSVTIHRVVPSASARYVRLEITTPQSSANFTASRVDELEIYAR
jgi:predicted alpha-1,6-mannanase (GH76 family)